MVKMVELYTFGKYKNWEVTFPPIGRYIANFLRAITILHTKPMDLYVPPSSHTSQNYTIQPFKPKDTSPSMNHLTCQSGPVHPLYNCTGLSNISYLPIQILRNGKVHPSSNVSQRCTIQPFGPKDISRWKPPDMPELTHTPLV